MMVANTVIAYCIENNIVFLKLTKMILYIKVCLIMRRWGSTVINRGIAGDNTFGVLARLNDVILRKPRIIFIEIGINDISQNIPSPIIIKNIIAIVQQLHSKSPATKIFITSILPSNANAKIEYPAAYGKDDIIDQTNITLIKNAPEYKYTYIDLNSQVKDFKGELDIKYADPDGLHLNAMGYEKWLNLINTVLSK